MKVKIFRDNIFSGGIERLEKEVNEFLEKTPKANVVWMQTPISDSPTTHGTIYLTAVISY